MKPHRTESARSFVCKFRRHATRATCGALLPTQVQPACGLPCRRRTGGLQ